MAGIMLSAEQEQEAKLLEAKIRGVVDQEISELARLLVSKGDRDVFGETEFQVRDVVLRMGAKMIEERLRGKKTAMRDRRSNALAANKRPSFTDIGRQNR